MEHPGVHKNSFRSVRAFQDRIGIWKCWFLGRGENRSTPRRKTSQSRVENQQQTQPTYDAGSGNRTQATLMGGKRCHGHRCVYFRNFSLLLCSAWFQIHVQELRIKKVEEDSNTSLTAAKYLGLKVAKKKSKKQNFVMAGKF